MLRLLIIILLVSNNNLLWAQGMTADPTMIKSIYFGGGSYAIDVYQSAELKVFIDSFPDIENYHITVHSYTDNIGSKEFNQMLSEMRSYTAIRKLLDFNVPREIIITHDFGEFNPIYNNSTLDGRLRNRRVDVILWPKEVL